MESFALCFDEVEELLLMQSLKQLFEMPRSMTSAFLVKFSAAPYVGVSAKLKGSDRSNAT
jgi:hypothetical protein